jgi:pimeloyl-ACP methyl ester carboxylesterase
VAKKGALIGGNGAPSFKMLAQEWRILPDWIAGRKVEATIAQRWLGDGRTVIVVPGMFTNDRRTALLRRVLRRAGYRTYGWELGRNMPNKITEVLDRLEHRVAYLQARHSRPVTLIGWSLGGIIAREYAKIAPDRVEGVITLGSPFSGSRKANNAWRAYEAFAGHSVEEPPFPGVLSEKPPMPTFAIWSARDGVIAPDAARGLEGERDGEMQVNCGHFAMSCAPDALEAVLRVLHSQVKNG